jgi:hypothetical protein
MPLPIQCTANAWPLPSSRRHPRFGVASGHARLSNAGLQGRDLGGEFAINWGNAMTRVLIDSSSMMFRSYSFRNEVARAYAERQPTSADIGV